METQNLRCASCGAPVPADAVQCPYCRAQAATVACPRCLGLVSVQARHCSHCGTAVDIQERGPADLACPDCRSPLLKASVGGVDLTQCARCGGLWLGRDLFERVAADREGRGAVLGALPGDGVKAAVVPGSVRYRPCPVCARFMNRTNYGRISGVILDTCRSHGLWFDKDELRRVLAFIEKGGLAKSREHQIRELDEKKRLAEAAKPLPTGAWDEPRLRRGPGLLDLVDALGAFVERLNR